MSTNEAALEKAYQRLRGIYRSCFHGADGTVHPAGAQVLRDLREYAGYGNSPFRSDPVAMAYEVGKQDVIRHLLRTMEVSDEELGRIVSKIAQQQETESDKRWGQD